MARIATYSLFLLSWTIYVRQGRGRKQSNPGALQLWVVENLTAPRCIVWVQTGMQMQATGGCAGCCLIFCCCLCAKQARGQGSCTRTTATKYQLHSQQLREQRSAASPACSVSLLTRDAWENGCRSLHTLTPKPNTLIRTTTFGTHLGVVMDAHWPEVIANSSSHKEVFFAQALAARKVVCVGCASGVCEGVRRSF